MVVKRGDTSETLAVRIGAASRWTQRQQQLQQERLALVGEAPYYNPSKGYVGRVRWKATEDIPPELAREVGLEEGQGLYVSEATFEGQRNEVNARYPRRGDIILSVNGQPVSSIKDYNKLCRGSTDKGWMWMPDKPTGRTKFFTLWREGQEALVMLRRK